MITIISILSQDKVVLDSLSSIRWRLLKLRFTASALQIHFSSESAKERMKLDVEMLLH